MATSTSEAEVLRAEVAALRSDVQDLHAEVQLLRAAQDETLSAVKVLARALLADGDSDA